MTRTELNNKLNRKDITGVGVKVITWDGFETYYFYEDFENSKGVERAAKHFQNAIDAENVRSAEYIYK